MVVQVNTRELVLQTLLEINKEGQYGHIAIRNTLEKYQYLEKQERAFITRVCEGTQENQIKIDYMINQFSKIQCDQNYHPKKKTVMALCIALHLDLEQSKDLLARADWAFSPSSKVDLIVQKAIIDKQYDMMQLNVTLFKYTNEILGV